MASPSSIAICSAALGKIGDDPITSLTDNTNRAKKCNIHYDPARKAVLRDHPWADSTKRVQLAQLSETPAWEFDYAYALPQDFMRLVYTSLGKNDPYRIEGKKLLCNVDEVFIAYVYDNQDVTSYDALHTDALIAKLAFELALAITGKASYRDAMAQEYVAKKNDAKAVNGQEFSQQELDGGDDLIDVR